MVNKNKRDYTNAHMTGTYLPLIQIQQNHSTDEFMVNVRVTSDDDSPREEEKLKFYQSMMSEESYVNINKINDPELTARQYFGQELSSDFDKLKYLSLEDFVDLIASYRVVKSVYILEDKRAVPGKQPTHENYVELIVKIDPKASIHLRDDPDFFHAMNETVTGLLVNRGIFGASGIRVSFQYSQLYYHGGEPIEE